MSDAADKAKKRNNQRQRRYEQGERRKEYKRLYNIAHREKFKKYRTEYNRTHKERKKELALNNRIRNTKWLLLHLGLDNLICQHCGYNKCSGIIQGHHLNPLQKENGRDIAGRWKSFSLKKFEEKVLNTELIFLCPTCHAEIHAGLWSIGDL